MHASTDSNLSSISIAPEDRHRSHSNNGRSQVGVQPFEPHHLPAVLALYAQVFGRRAAADFEARWAWSQENNLFPDNTPKWVLNAGDALVGFLATVPQGYWVNGRMVVAHTPSDYMVHPDYRFHGLNLMQTCFQACGNIVSCDDIAATKRVSQWLGASPVARLVRYAKLLDPRALRASRRWSLMSSSFAWPAAQALRLRDYWRAGRQRHLAMTPVDAFDSRFDGFAKRLAQSVPVMPARDAQFLNWRYGPGSPHADRQVSVVEDEAGELAGYVIVHRSSGPMRAGRILDLQCLPEVGDRLAPALLAYAIQQLRLAGAWTVYYHRMDSPFSLPTQLLARWGLVPRGRHEVLVRFGEEALRQPAALSANWSLSYGDSEASHAAT